MPRAWPTIDDRTVHLLGDFHWGRIDKLRLAVMVADLDSGYEDDPPAGRVQVGDITHYAQTQQLTNSVAWLDANLPGCQSEMPEGRNWCAIAGNHDRIPIELIRDPATDDTNSYDYQGGPGDWNDATGLEDAYAVDLGFVRLLCVSWVSNQRLTTDQMDWLDAEAAAATQECWIVAHAPLYDTVGGPTKGIRTVYESTKSGFYTDGPGGSNSSEVLDLLAGYDNLRAFISGHTHSPIGAPGLVETVVAGGKNVAAINAGALIYEYPAYQRGAPIHTLYARRDDDAITVSFRDHGLAGWKGPRRGVRVERVVMD